MKPLASTRFQKLRDLLSSHTGKSFNTAESAVLVRGADGEARFEVALGGVKHDER